MSLAFTPTAGTLTLTVTGSVTLAMLAFGALTTYQAITTAASYDTVGWPKYLKFDGIDDYLKLPYMGLYANMGASVLLSAAMVIQSTTGYIVSESSQTNTQCRYTLGLKLLSSDLVAPLIRDNIGTVFVSAPQMSFSPNTPNILSAIDSGTKLQFTINPSGSSNYSLYERTTNLTPTNTVIGALNNGVVQLFSSMSIHGLIITKSALSDTDRKRCEQFLASRLTSLGVTLS